MQNFIPKRTAKRWGRYQMLMARVSSCNLWFCGCGEGFLIPFFFLDSAHIDHCHPIGWCFQTIVRSVNVRKLTSQSDSNWILRDPLMKLPLATSLERRGGSGIRTSNTQTSDCSFLSLLKTHRCLPFLYKFQFSFHNTWDGRFLFQWDWLLGFCSVVGVHCNWNVKDYIVEIKIGILPVFFQIPTSIEIRSTGYLVKKNSFSFSD